MKKVLFIVHEYYPNVSAITNCIAPYIKKMQEKNIEVNILTRRLNIKSKKTELMDNVYVYRINDLFNTYNNAINEFAKTNKFLLFYYKCLRKIMWIYYSKFKKMDDGFYNTKKFIKLGNKIVKNKKCDTIISCSYPFESHKIAFEIKKANNIKWIAIQFDPHSNNFSKCFDEELIKIKMKEEIDILSNSDKVFIPFETYNSNIKTDLVKLKNKYKILCYPLIKKSKFVISKKTIKKNDPIIFTFAGTLYDNIRDPFPMLDFFINLDMNYSLHLYYIAEANIENKLLEYKIKMGDKLVLHSRRTKKECDEALAKTNFIVNIGNTILNQTPSKVYELVCIGKPIINFYTIENDTSKEILKNYELKFNAFLPNVDKNRFKKFVENNKNNCLSFEEATEKYKKAEELAEEFVEDVININEK